MPFDFFAMKKPVIAMAHLGALPGTPLYDAAGGVDKLVAGVLADVGKLQDGGVDAIMFGNENDRPYVFAAPLEGIAAMTAVIQVSHSSAAWMYSGASVRARACWLTR